MRPAREIILPAEVGKDVINIPACEIIDQEKRIRIIQGETLFIEFKEQGEELLPIRAYTKRPEKIKTVEFALSYQDGASMLKVLNPYPRPLSYKCWTSTYQEQGFVNRNNLPAPPNKPMFEIYPGFVVELGMRNFVLGEPVK